MPATRPCATGPAGYEKAHYMLGTAAGPHPFPTIVREFQRMIGEETKAQLLEKEGRLPDAVIACVGGGSNAIGMFADFIDETAVGLIGVSRQVTVLSPASTARRFNTVVWASISV